MNWLLRGEHRDLDKCGMIMGILNVTPDSFSDGGQNVGVDKAVKRALKMVEEGAEIIDIGGESTRPDALVVSLNTELERTVPVVRALREKSDVYISIDTSKAEVARQALEAGADIVNDVTGLTGDSEMVGVCVASECAVVVMHMLGNPRTMQRSPIYSDVVADVRAFFEERLEALTQAGVKKEAICLDPGIGFGKTLEHNKVLMRSLEELGIYHRPLMLGVSRKSMIGAILEKEDPQDRDWGTVALTAFGRKLGVHVHRVHDVRKNTEAMRMMEAML